MGGSLWSRVTSGWRSALRIAGGTAILTGVGAWVLIDTQAAGPVDCGTPWGEFVARHTNGLSDSVGRLCHEDLTNQAVLGLVLISLGVLAIMLSVLRIHRRGGLLGT